MVDSSLARFMTVMNERILCMYVVYSINNVCVFFFSTKTACTTFNRVLVLRNRSEKNVPTSLMVTDYLLSSTCRLPKQHLLLLYAIHTVDTCPTLVQLEF